MNPAASPTRTFREIGSSESSTRGQRAPNLNIYFVLAAEFLAYAILRIPYDLGFIAFAFADRGSWLTVNYLSMHGRIPAVDFGYAYGLLPVAIGSAWFRILGLTPHAYQAMMVICGLAMASAIARIVRTLRVPVFGVILTLAAIPFAIQSSYPSIAHAVEAALLCNALAEQAAGRRANALMLAAGACYCKPAMGYLYGALLILFFMLELYRSGKLKLRTVDVRSIARILAPAAAISLMLAVLIATLYGPRPLGTTLLPLTGIKNYKALNFGFTGGHGKYFWYGAPISSYTLTVLGFWFAASAWLVVEGIGALMRLFGGRDPAQSRRDELVATAAILHVAFVAIFFGGPASWSYYSYILVVGVIGASVVESGKTPLVAAMAVLAITGQTSVFAQSLTTWREQMPSAQTAGLWATSQDRANMNGLLSALDDHKAALLEVQGCAPLLFLQFEQRRHPYLLPGIFRQHDLEDEIRWLSTAPAIATVTARNLGDPLVAWPQLKQTVTHRRLVYSNSLFALYQ